MFMLRWASLMLMVNVYMVGSQTFRIGVLDQDVLSYLQGKETQNFTLVLISVVNLNTATGYVVATSTLTTLDVLIGRFDFSIASICQQLNLPYFYLDNIVQNFPGALLEPNNDLITEAQMLLIYLSKYNINFPLRFISDGSSDVLNFRFGLNEIAVSQCNFNQNATTSLINQCYQSVFKGNTKSNYIFMTDSSNTGLLDSYLQQSLYMSIPYLSMLIFPMVDITSIMNKYSYSGGFLLEVSPESTTLNVNSTLIQRNALTNLLHVIGSLRPYRKINDTHWISNNITSYYNKSFILSIIKAYNNVYHPNGQRFSKAYTINSLSGGNLNPISTFIYTSGWNENKANPNPATSGSKGFISVIYFYDSVFVTEVSGISGVTITGYAVDLFNNILPPIQLSFTSLKLPTSPFVGRLVNKSFTGLLGFMTASEFTMTAFPVPIIPSYRSLLTYSDQIAIAQYSILVKKPEPSVDYFKLARPYSPLVWISILATIVVLSIILFLINLISPNVASETDKLTVNTSIFMVFGSFLIAKMLVKPNMFSTQLFYLLIWLGTLLLISSYVSKLFAILAFTNPTQITFTTYERLFQQKNFQWTFVINSYLHNAVLDDIDNNQSSLYRKMFIYAQQNWPTQYLIKQEDTEAFAYNFSNFVVLNDDIHNMKISLRNCSLTTVVDSTLQFPLAYVINPSFQFIKDFYLQILNVRENGVLDTLATKYFQTGICSTSSITSGKIVQLDTTEMAGIFILIIIGIVLSLIVALIEFIFAKGSLQCQRVVTGNSLQFGKTYKAKVKALDKNGVTVDIGQQSIFSRKNDARIYYVHKRFLCHKIKDNSDIPSPTEQGIMIGTTLHLKYLGNNPEDSKRKFIQVSKK